jgi:hypothetical protein
MTFWCERIQQQWPPEFAVVVLQVNALSVVECNRREECKLDTNGYLGRRNSHIEIIHMYGSTMGRPNPATLAHTQSFSTSPQGSLLTTK